MRKLLLAVAVLLSPAYVMAAPPPQVGDTFNPNDLNMNGVALSGSPCATVRVDHFGAFTWYALVTYGAATSLNMTCTRGIATNILAPVPVQTVASSGTISYNDASFTYPSGGVTRWYTFQIGPLNDKFLKCCFSGTGATTDTITAYGYAGDN